MANENVSPFGREAELYPKSSGETALNEDQIVQPFTWTNNADKSEVVVSLKKGYSVNTASNGVFYTGNSTITEDFTISSSDINYMTIGPVTIADGVTVTVDGGNWVII